MIQIPDAITSKRLVIRRFEDADLDGFLDFMTNPHATRHLVVEPNHKTEAGAKALFETVVESYASDEPVWALAISSEPEGFIGSCGFSPLDDGIFECYYSLLPEHWGNGYATEAAGALVDFLFEHSPVEEVRAYVSPNNPKSGAVALRVGMEDRGMQVHPGFDSEGRMFSINREEWESDRDVVESKN